MHKRKVMALAVVFLMGMAASAQQQAQPLTFWYGYTVKAGQEAAFMELVNLIGAPVRDKLMAEGVVLGWGVEVPVLRSPDGHTHLIWYAVADWSGVEKVQRALAAQIASVAAEQAKAGEARRGQRPGPTLTERIEAAVDNSKTRDYLTRDLVFGETSTAPPAGTLPLTRYNFYKAHPGKFGDWRRAWEKYNKPVFDKLVADGVVLAYGLAVEELKTDSNFTHFVWFAVKSAEDFSKIGPAFNADRARRSEDERSALNAAFAGLLDSDATRNYVTMSTVFKVAAQK
jgi:hypothetical protein